MQISESAFNIHRVQFQYPSGRACGELSHISPPLPPIKMGQNANKAWGQKRAESLGQKLFQFLWLQYLDFEKGRGQLKN